MSPKGRNMAKKGNRQHIVLISESGHTYHTTKNKMNTKDRVEIKKYDPQVRQHVAYREKK